MAARRPPSHPNNHDQAERVEPLFVQRSAAEDVSGPVTILGAQPQGRGKTHFRLYPRTNQDRLALVQAGAITLRGQEASLLQKNPFVVRPGATTTRVIVSNVLLSYDNEEISKTLTTRRYKLMSRISVGAFVAEFYHREQRKAGRSRAQKCSNYLQEGHHRSMCENEIICHQCKKPGHKRGDPACELENREFTITSVAETNTGYTSNSRAEPEMERRQESDTGDEASEADETDGEPILDNPGGRTETRQPRGRGYSTRSRTHTSSNVNNQKQARDNNSDNSTPNIHVDEQRDSTQPSIELWLKEQRKAKGKQGARGNCPKPPTLPNTWRQGCYFPYAKRELCQYHCRSGYHKVSGSHYKTCHDGAWYGDDLVCSRGCPAPPWPTNTELPSGCNNPFTNREICTYRCRPGYTQVSGSTVRTCSNGAWTGTDLVCTGGRNCTTPPNPANSNAYVTGCSYPYTNGEKCYYRCRPGYIPDRGNTIRACYIHWTGTDLFCVLDLRPDIDRSAETAPRLPGPTCHAPPTPAYTSMSGCSSPYLFNEKCTYQCLPGYTQVSGSTVRTCYYGHWTGKDLFCSNGQNCRKPANIPYAYWTGCSSPYNNGDSCSYQCRHGFMRDSGSITRTCSNGTWTGTNLRACVDSLGVLSSVGSVV
ncbi:hypothetical protein Bbelb_159250 [Branchiostoma belcheri]|nr:hypothetical protein Bbelb_159250 [Branchiostoma belcheri]